jgi:hypothetical protein
LAAASCSGLASRAEAQAAQAITSAVMDKILNSLTNIFPASIFPTRLTIQSSEMIVSDIQIFDDIFYVIIEPGDPNGVFAKAHLLTKPGQIANIAIITRINGGIMTAGAMLKMQIVTIVEIGSLDWYKPQEQDNNRNELHDRLRYAVIS